MNSRLRCKLSNKTTNKLATVLLQADDGKMTVEYINPGEVLTKKYNTKKLEIQVLYQESDKPKTKINTIEFVKEQVKKIIINKNGKLEEKELTAFSIRG